VNTVFAPDWFGNANAMLKFMMDPSNYQNAIVPKQMMDSFVFTMKAINRRLRSGDLFEEGDFNRWTLNHLLAVHPVTRFLTAMVYRSGVNGLTKLNYPGTSLLKSIDFDKLYGPDKPFLFHNAWNLSSQELQLFCNDQTGTYRDAESRPYKPITPASLCACSALPYIEQTVEIDGDVYCEGALVDTVNFKDLLRDHDDLEEIWISRIVDANQVRAPDNLHDSLANLCELFAATVGDDDVKLFEYHVMHGDKTNKNEKKWEGLIVEIPVDHEINFEWSHSNLERGWENGMTAAKEAFKQYEAEKKKKQRPLVIGGSSREDRMRRARARFFAAGRARPSAR
jgi:predicted acylesterase/phospholipase RssA